MKRHGNLWDDIASMDNFWAAYRAARKGKTWQRTVQCFEAHAERRLQQLQRMLLEKSFTTSRYKTKTIYEPKKRLILHDVAV